MDDSVLNALLIEPFQLVKLVYLAGYARGKFDKMPQEVPEEDQIECHFHMDDGFRTMLMHMSEIQAYLEGTAN